MHRVAYGTAWASYWEGAAVMGLNMLWRLVKTRSFAAMMFGAPVRHTVGEVEMGVKRTARIHALQSTEPDLAVGFELVSKTALSYSLIPLALSKKQARELAKLLEEASAI